jgi:hypothetical protein
MPRSRDTVDASLELLLDTITNTFGSVLFITMLVAILLRVSGKAESRQEPVSPVDQARAEARVTELTDEIARLTVAIASLPSDDPAVAAVEASILAAAGENARVLADDARLAAEMIRDQTVAIEIEQRVASAEKDLARLKILVQKESDRLAEAEKRSAALAKIAIDLDRPVDPKQIIQNVQLPTIADTEKRQFGVLMRYGRLYVMHRRAADGERSGPNTEDFVVTRKPDGSQSARARPDAGHIADGATVLETLRRILGPYPPTEWVIAIVVNEDSFSQFQSVKSALIDLKYQYEPFSYRKDEGIWDTGGKGRGQ